MVIRVENLSFTYAKASAPAVRDLNFNIERGEIFGFLGPSGAGKSTTQKILIGLLRNYGGLVSVLGKDLASWKSDYYERIGVSFEIPNHYLKLTAKENLSYFSALYSGPTESPQALLDMVGLGEDGQLLVSQFSKGMKNRLTLARSLLNKPELLFWDEPTAGLDPSNARRIREIAKAQKQAGRTIFLTTHDMAVADELCDRIAFIANGELKLIDAPRELKLKYGEPRVRVEYRDEGLTARREFPLEGLGDNADFLNLLRGERVQTIHTQEATLEDIFISVTGRSLS